MEIGSVQLVKPELSSRRFAVHVENLDLEFEESLSEPDKAMTEGGLQQHDSKTGGDGGIHDEASSEGTGDIEKQDERKVSRCVNSSDVARKTDIITELPEELVEKVVSMLPFPTLLKARLLSKAWNLRFSSPSFQYEVSGSSYKWPRYCPVIVSGREMMGFNSASNHWEKIVIPESVPLDFDPEVGEIVCGGIFLRLACGGPLMCVVERAVREPPKVLMANVVTGSWRRLPSPPFILTYPATWLRGRRNLIPSEVAVIRSGPDGYKVLLVYYNQSFKTHNRISTQLYDSKSGKWTGSHGLVNLGYVLHGCVIDGNVYFLSILFRDLVSMDLWIWKYNVEDGVCAKTPYNVELEEGEKSVSGGICLCGSSAMVVTVPWTRPPTGGYFRARVHELNLQTLQLTELSRSPPITCHPSSLMNIESDSDCIYVYHQNVLEPVTISVFSVIHKRWSLLPPPPGRFAHCKPQEWVRSAFDPGLYPFTNA